MKKIIVGFICAFLASFAYANEVEFVAVAPPSVIAGQQFRLAYTLNQEGKDLRAPELPNFDVLMGPSVSRSSSIQIINGHVDKSMQVTYTYVLIANEPGTYTLAPATVQVKGKKYSSQSLSIKVLPPDQSATSTSTASSASGAQGNTNAARNVPNATLNQGNMNQVFVRTLVSKSKVYEQEALLITYKLYTRMDVAAVSGAKFPEFKDFYVQEIDLGNNQSWTVDHYDGLNYNTVILKQTLLFPQRSGKLTVDAGSCDVILRVATGNRRQSFFDSFFDTYQEVQKTLPIPSLTLQVKALPEGAPRGFSGAVGQFQLSSQLSSTEVKANDALTLKLKISGTGNLKLLKTPKVTFPLDFEVYDPKVDNKIQVNASGVSGSKTIEYVSIPRFGGDFEIPSTSFVYFDPKVGEYKVLKTPLYKVQVTGSSDNSATPATGTYVVSQESVKNVGSDIRFIQTPDQLSLHQERFYGSTFYYLAYIIPLLVFLLVLFILHKQAQENANLALVKNKRANKLARKRLKAANKCLHAQDATHFYEEVMHALWGYTADKLNIPVAHLTKDNIREELLQHHAPEDLIQDFLQTLSDCEFARFSSVVDENLSMDVIYNRAADLIQKLDNQIK